MRQIVGTTAWALGELWFGAVAILDRVLAHVPWRWSR